MKAAPAAKERAMELTVQELAKLEQTTYLLIDMRSEETRAYGMLPGAIPPREPERE